MKEKIIKYWNDSVFSKLIAALIIFLISLFYSSITALINNDSKIYLELLRFWNYEIKLWIVAWGLFVLMLGLGISKNFFRKRDNKKDDIDKRIFDKIKRMFEKNDLVSSISTHRYEYKFDKVMYENVTQIINEYKRSELNFFNDKLQYRNKLLIKHLNKFYLLINRNSSIDEEGITVVKSKINQIQKEANKVYLNYEKLAQASKKELIMDIVS